MSLLLTYFLFYSQMLRRELTITFFFLFIKMDTLESSAWTLSGSLSHIGPGQVSPFTKVPKSLEHFCLKTLMIIFLVAIVGHEVYGNLQFFWQVDASKSSGSACWAFCALSAAPRTICYVYYIPNIGSTGFRWVVKCKTTIFISDMAHLKIVCKGIVRWFSG